MKIAQVVNNFSHTSIPIELAELMAAEEDVDIISLYDDQQYVEQMINSNGKSIRRIYGCGAKHGRLKGIKKLYDILMDGDYDIIHTHHTLSAMAVSHYHKKMNAKLITTIHGNSHSYSLIQNIICGYIIHRVDGIAYNSNTTKNEMYGWQKRCIKATTFQKVIYNGINIDRIKNASTDYANVFRNKYGIPKKSFLLVQVGRLEKVKNPFSTLIAFEKFLLMNNKDDMYLVFVGDGSQRDELQSYTNNSKVLCSKTVFTGTISRDEVYSLMHDIDIQIIPSYYEGFCNALFESISLGNQVTVSNISVFSELINELEGVEMFDPNDIDSIVLALTNTVKNGLTEKNRKKYIEFAKSHFDSDICKKQYFSLYREALT